MWTNRDGNVTVTPEDEDRFTIKVGRAIEALNLAKQQDSFHSQLSLLLRVLADWISEHDGIQNAHLTMRDGALSFVVVRSCGGYDEAFEDELSELDIQIAKDVDLDLIRLNVLCLPGASDEAIESFLDPSFLLTYNDQRAKPHSSGQQESPSAGTAASSSG